jgi:hypothetical protein
MSRKVTIPHVAWRNGRPRFVPSASLRAEGHQGHDLKDEAGAWLTEGQALDWSRAFTKKLKDERRQARNVAAELREVRAAPKLRRYSVADMMRDWLGSPIVKSKSANTLRDYRQKTRVLEDVFLKVKAWDEFDHRTAPEGTKIPEKPDQVDRAIALVWIADAAALTRPICYTLWEHLLERRRLHTANAVLTCLGMAIEYAQKKGRLAEARNPAHKLGKITPKTQVRWAEPQEVEALIAAADGLDRPEIGDMVALGVWIGQRQGDRLALQLGQLAGGRFSIDQSKTGARVSIPLAPALGARLKRSAERRRQAEKIMGHVVVDEVGWQPFKADWYRHVFADVRTEAAKTVPSVARIRDKDLRATAVMWLALAGCTNTQIAAITGHTLATVDQILKHYWTTSAAQADDAMAKLVAWHQKQGS